MSPTRWVGRSIAVGVGYAAIGVLFALPSTHGQFWRLAAWAMSAIVYAAHIGYERFKLRTSSGATALHVAIAVAVGAFGLAVAATVHSWIVPPTYHRSRFLLALVLWPILTGVPAYLVALAVSAVLDHLPGHDVSAHTR